MKNSKIKYGLIGLLVILLLITIIGVGRFACNMFFSKGAFVNDEKLINNSYNNSFFANGELAVNNNDLYFYFHGEDNANEFRLYKINSLFGERVDGSPVSPGNLLKPLQVYKKDILIDYGAAFKGTIYKLNTLTNMEEKYSSLNNAEVNQYRYYKAIDDKLYVFSDDKIYYSPDGVKTEEIFNGCADIIAKNSYEKMIYIKDDVLLYITKDGYIKMYDTNSKREVFRKKLNLKQLNISDDLSNIKSVFICDNRAFIAKEVTSDNNEIAIYEVTDNIKKVYYNDGLFSMNVCGYYIYICSENNGIDVINTHTYVTKNLTDEKASNIYILGDKWAYFTNEEGSLKRVLQKGGKVEKVFG
jgi:WD40 repeat protein